MDLTYNAMFTRRIGIGIGNRLFMVAPLIALVSIQGILTGIFGAPSIVSTMIASRAMSPKRALVLSTVAQLLGPFLFGVAVAGVIGSEVVDTQGLTPLVLYASLSATIFWMVFSWYVRIPCSSTHALVGGLVGSVIAGAGPSAIHSAGLLKVLASLILTAPLGILGGFLMVRLCYFFTQNATPRINYRFNQGQLVASLGLGLAIGSINAQNAMGMMALGLVLTGNLPRFFVPTWVIVLCAGGLALGNLIGGMRLVHTVGAKFFQVRPIHGFSAELASALIISVSSLIGGNVSATHVTTLSVVGAGAAERLSMVRWGFVQHVLLTWVLTIPVTATLAGLLYSLFYQISMGIR